MKKFLAVAVVMFASCGMSLAWNCSVAGEVPSAGSCVIHRQWNGRRQ